MQGLDSSLTPQTTPTDQSPFEAGWRLFAVAVSYYLAGRLGLLIPYVGTHVSLVWLPTGIALAAYLRWGASMVPAILIAAFAVNYRTGGPAWMAAAIAVGNAAGPGVSAWLLIRVSFDTSLTRGRDLGAYLIAVMLGMVVTATNGTFWLHEAGLLPSAVWPAAWATWWTGDAVGALLGGIPLVATTRLTLQETFGGRAGFINGALLGVVLLCGALIFWPWKTPPTVLYFPLMSVPLFVTAVLALRAGVLSASLAALVFSACAAWGTAEGVGPFAVHTDRAGLLALWSYLTAQVCTSVLICGLTAELLASRREQAAMFTHANDGIVLVFADGQVGPVNPSARAMLDLPNKGARVDRLADLPHGNGKELAVWLASAPSTRDTRYLRLARRDGSMLEVEAHTAQHADARGRPVAQLMLRDVTERRNSEARVAASEERLRSITDNAPALIAEFDDQTRFLFANRTYRQWLGLDPLEILGRSMADVLGASVFESIEPQVAAALRGEAATYERRIDGPEGVRHIHVSLVPRRSPDGAVPGFYVVGSDITERLRAEEAVRRSEALLRSVADRLPMRVSFIDHEERYRFLNLAYERAFGEPRDALYGRTVREVIGEGAYAGAAPHIHSALGGKMVSFESEMTTREGYRCYRATYVPQRSEDEVSVHGFVAIITDTTAQKLKERRLVELSQIDSLTGLLNRAGFGQRRQEAFGRSQRSRRRMAMMLLDIDGFKRINDTHGHLAGDMLLQGFAARLTKTLRADDFVARPGGDEFAVIVEGLEQAEDVRTIAHNILGAMQAPFVLETERIAVTASIGVAVYEGEPNVSARDLTKLADDLLYAAKEAGRNRYCIGNMTSNPPRGEL